MLPPAPPTRRSETAYPWAELRDQVADTQVESARRAARRDEALAEAQRLRTQSLEAQQPLAKTRSDLQIAQQSAEQSAKQVSELRESARGIVEAYEDLSRRQEQTVQRLLR